MIRQYGPTVSRFRRIETPRGVMDCGVIPVGTICNVRGRRVIVEAWLPRFFAKIEGKSCRTVRIRGGHMAQVRKLSGGKPFMLSDAWLLDAEEAS